ncbi:hypothetical protein ADUPG1_005421, partial [Aduncisulcus paluster]
KETEVSTISARLSSLEERVVDLRSKLSEQEKIIEQGKEQIASHLSDLDSKDKEILRLKTLHQEAIQSRDKLIELNDQRKKDEESRKGEKRMRKEAKRRIEEEQRRRVEEERKEESARKV